MRYWLMIFLPCCWQFSIAAELAPERQQQLRHFLVQDCGSCHGMTLQGGLGSPLLPENLVGKTDESLVSTILLGRPNTAMPAWRGVLTENEALWLIQELRKGVFDEP